jgi:aquaporin Z
VDMRKILAELVGTFVFFSFGLIAVLSTLAFSGGPDLLVIALGFGVGLFVGIQVAGAISGGHFNPAVTVAAVLDGRLDWINGVGYVIAQLVGGFGAGLLVLSMSSQEAVAKTITHPGNGVSDIQAVVLEAVFTAIFICVILTVTKNLPAFAAVAIPATLVVTHLALVPFTGSSVNPARSIVSAAIGGDLSAIWIYIVGPIIGAVIGWGVFRGLSGDMGKMRPK